MLKKTILTRTKPRNLGRAKGQNLAGRPVKEKCEIRIEMLVESLLRFNEHFGDLDVAGKPDSYAVNDLCSAVDEIEKFMTMYAEDEVALIEILRDESGTFSGVIDGTFPEWDTGSLVWDSDGEENQKLLTSIDKKVGDLVNAVRNDGYELYYVMTGAI